MSSASRLPALLPAALVLPWLALAPIAAAVEPLDTFNARVGGYLSRFDTQIRADGETIGGTPIDFERDLGLDQDSALAFIGLTWRPFEHHEFGLGYYRDDTSRTRRLQRDIVFDGTLYQTNTTIRTNYDFDSYELSYTWWALSRERWALGPRLGVVWYSTSLSIELRLDVNGNDIGGSISDRVSADLPAPTIGAGWRWTPAEDWRIAADVGYFSANANDLDADVVFGRLGVEWYPWERFGFSLVYNVNDIGVDADKTSFTGDLNLRDSGLQLGLNYRF